MITVDINIKDKRWKKAKICADYEKFTKKIIAEILSVLKIELPEDSCVETSVFLTNDKEIQEINKKYRNKNAPTNVLSFQLLEDELNEEIREKPHLILGDIFISLETLKREADSQGKSLSDHFTHLFTHSFLHLLGFDHNDEESAEAMEGLETLILERLGIENPY